MAWPDRSRPTPSRATAARRHVVESRNDRVTTSPQTRAVWRRESPRAARRARRRPCAGRSSKPFRSARCMSVTGRRNASASSVVLPSEITAVVSVWQGLGEGCPSPFGRYHRLVEAAQITWHTARRASVTRALGTMSCGWKAGSSALAMPAGGPRLPPTRCVAPGAAALSVKTRLGSPGI